MEYTKFCKNCQQNIGHIKEGNIFRCVECGNTIIENVTLGEINPQLEKFLKELKEKENAQK